MSHTGAIKALQRELKELNDTPVEGFRINPNIEDIFIWDVAIFGPPMTLYEGGYFKARLFFPKEYPYRPPSVKFLSKMFHPNIYANGDVCISILHNPGDDPQSGELASERWNPTQNVRTILLSIISLLNEPNIHSAAHVDASISYRNWTESNAKLDEYEKIVRSLVELTYADAVKDGVTVPRTLEEYCISGHSGISDASGQSTEKNTSDFGDDDDYGFDIEDDYLSDVTNEDTDNDDQPAGHMDRKASDRVKDDRRIQDGADSAMEETEFEIDRKTNLNCSRTLVAVTPVPSISESAGSDRVDLTSVPPLPSTSHSFPPTKH